LATILSTKTRNPKILSSVFGRRESSRPIEIWVFPHYRQSDTDNLLVASLETRPNGEGGGEIIYFLSWINGL
jgi:hypothetical protein